MDNSLIYAAAPPPNPPLTVDERQMWNDFVGYLDKQGLKGSAALDNRDTKLGQRLMEQYAKANPKFSLTYDRVGDVQKDLQDYRQQLINQYKSGKAAPDSGITSPDEIMAGISPVDGWLGSKTSSYKYPGATLTTATPTGTKKVDYGVNTAAYDAAVANMRK